MVNSKGLADAIGVSIQSINLARKNGRITPIKKEGREYFYEIEEAKKQYFENTRQPKIKTLTKDGYLSQEENEDFVNIEKVRKIKPKEDDCFSYGKPKTSVLDKESKFWSTQEAINAKYIYDALLKKQEYDTEVKKLLSAKIVEDEILRITREFTRALVVLPSKLKQKIDKLDDDDIEIIKEACAEIVSNCESKL